MLCFPHCQKRPAKIVSSLELQTNPPKFWPGLCRTTVMVVTGGVHRKFSPWLWMLKMSLNALLLSKSSKIKKVYIRLFATFLMHTKFTSHNNYSCYISFFSSAEVEDLLRRYPEFGTELLAKMRGIRPVEKWVKARKGFKSTNGVCARRHFFCKYFFSGINYVMIIKVD